MTDAQNHIDFGKNRVVSALLIVGFILLFFLGIQMMGSAFKVFGQDISLSNLGDTTPFVGLFVGLLITAILQSSSTTTSLAVAAVASGSFHLDFAIPVVLGANIGTTITSTIVALGYVTKSNQFRKAMSAAMIHDMFNILAVLVVFPLELKYQFLRNGSEYLAGLIPVGNSGGIYVFNDIFEGIIAFVLHLVGPYVGILLSIILLFATLKAISNLLYNRMIGRAKNQMQLTFFKNKSRAFGFGVFLTAVVQSSSLTSSLIVPLVATNKVALKRAFQFLMGANIGTTLTAIIAALFRSEEAMGLAIAHFLFNAIAVVIFIGIPAMGKLPLFLAERLGFLMFKFRASAFAYITLAFFAVPFSLIYFSNTESKDLIDSEQEVASEVKK